ncbi:hypothetical protein F2P56_036713 [Juglans regia]|uniref:Uncharacterized protein n=1 Tax=Juglans regia TaxID=51240 RepID=A0A833TZP2_JUGRE|nr:hypothetical protein F2P56_036713 [Juglans regia]
MPLPNCQAQRRKPRAPEETPPSLCPLHTQKTATSTSALGYMHRPSECSALPQPPHNKESKSSVYTHPKSRSLPSALHRTVAPGTGEATTMASARGKTRCFHREEFRLKRKIEASTPASKQGS